MSRRKIAAALALLYLLGAAAITASLFFAGHPGVGYLPMIIWVLPMTLAGFAAVYWPFGVAFPFMPAAFGFYGGHIVFFLPSTALIAWLIWRVIRGKSS